MTVAIAVPIPILPAVAVVARRAGNIDEEFREDVLAELEAIVGRSTDIRYGPNLFAGDLARRLEIRERTRLSAEKVFRLSQAENIRPDTSIDDANVVDGRLRMPHPDRGGE